MKDSKSLARAAQAAQVKKQAINTPAVAVVPVDASPEGPTEQVRAQD